MLDQYIKSLADEYIHLCSLMNSGQYASADYARLSADRTNVHNELIRLLGPSYARPFDMLAWARQLQRPDG